MPSTRSATSERPEENRQQLEEKAGTVMLWLLAYPRRQTKN
ncbi:hypothetical protein T09_11489 [Trichinella sp. T9]|nr:hypothetical protein T09_11489 [Trichinella sp. T9]